MNTPDHTDTPTVYTVDPMNDPFPAFTRAMGGHVVSLSGVHAGTRLDALTLLTPANDTEGEN